MADIWVSISSAEINLQHRLPNEPKGPPHDTSHFPVLKGHQSIGPLRRRPCQRPRSALRGRGHGGAGVAGLIYQGLARRTATEGKPKAFGIQRASPASSSVMRPIPILSTCQSHLTAQKTGWDKIWGCVGIESSRNDGSPFSFPFSFPFRPSEKGSLKSKHIYIYMTGDQVVVQSASTVTVVQEE